MDSALTVSMTKKPSKRCCLSGCTDKVATLIGDCRYCQLAFCARHRLPEMHQCANIDTVKKDAYDKNAHALVSNKCVERKIASI
jgi:predicted nucleic acid binding AN1-type Zn finger protein